MTQINGAHANLPSEYGDPEFEGCSLAPLWITLLACVAIGVLGVSGDLPIGKWGGIALTTGSTILFVGVNCICCARGITKLNNWANQSIFGMLMSVARAKNPGNRRQ